MKLSFNKYWILIVIGIIINIFIFVNLSKSLEKNLYGNIDIRQDVDGV